MLPPVLPTEAYLAPAAAPVLSPLATTTTTTTTTTTGRRAPPLPLQQPPAASFVACTAAAMIFTPDSENEGEEAEEQAEQQQQAESMAAMAAALPLALLPQPLSDVRVRHKPAKSADRAWVVGLPNTLYKSPYLWDLQVEAPLLLQQQQHNAPRVHGTFALLKVDNGLAPVENGLREEQPFEVQCGSGLGRARLQFLACSYMHGRSRFVLQLTLRDELGHHEWLWQSTEFTLLAKKNRRPSAVAGRKRRAAATVDEEEEEEEEGEEEEAVAAPPRKRAATHRPRYPSPGASTQDLRAFVHGLSYHERQQLLDLLQHEEPQQ